MADEGVVAKLLICGSCHGAAGHPSDPTIPVIWGQQQAYLEKQLRDYKSGGRDNQIMSSMAEGLKKEDIPLVAAFFASKAWPARHDGDAAAPAPDALAACQACHQENFMGGAAAGGVAPRLAGQSQVYLADAMRSFASGERANSADMSALMKAIPAAEREAMARYLSSL